eukprot:2927358-Rhodomonas_salina.1
MHGGVNGERRTPAQRAEEEARLEGLRRIKATKPEVCGPQQRPRAQRQRIACTLQPQSVFRMLSGWMEL